MMTSENEETFSNEARLQSSPDTTDTMKLFGVSFDDDGTEFGGAAGEPSTTLQGDGNLEAATRSLPTEIYFEKSVIFPSCGPVEEQCGTILDDKIESGDNLAEENEEPISEVSRPCEVPNGQTDPCQDCKNPTDSIFEPRTETTLEEKKLHDIPEALPVSPELEATQDDPTPNANGDSFQQSISEFPVLTETEVENFSTQQNIINTGVDSVVYDLIPQGLYKRLEEDLATQQHTNNTLKLEIYQKDELIAQQKDQIAQQRQRIDEKGQLNCQQKQLIDQQKETIDQLRQCVEMLKQQIYSISRDPGPSSGTPARSLKRQAEAALPGSSSGPKISRKSGRCNRRWTEEEEDAIVSYMVQDHEKGVQHIGSTWYINDMKMKCQLVKDLKDIKLRDEVNNIKRRSKDPKCKYYKQLEFLFRPSKVKNLPQVASPKVLPLNCTRIQPHL